MITNLTFNHVETHFQFVVFMTVFTLFVISDVFAGWRIFCTKSKHGNSSSTYILILENNYINVIVTFYTMQNILEFHRNISSNHLFDFSNRSFQFLISGNHFFPHKKVGVNYRKLQRIKYI
jgi:hypothetical protein